MGSSTFLAFCAMHPTCKGSISLFPAILALGNTWVHSCTSDSGDVSREVEELVDKDFGLGSIL